MIGWHTLAAEGSELYSPIGFRLLDNLTSKGPIGKVESELDLKDAGGAWRTTDIKPVVTLSGILAYPALERRADVVGQPPRRYRARLKADYYIPLYRRTRDGIEFDAFPYNDTNPPAVITTSPMSVILVPATNYPFPTHLRVLRGVVVDVLGNPVSDVEVRLSNIERVITDEKGNYGLPIRWAQNGTSLNIDADHARTNRSGMITVTLPQDLGASQRITIF
ncbi:MAG TPA: hypothetical protein VF131_26700 [Blastocatellia bacterium]|nr:hypothetical protein [Blastocatellia bacterium]